MDTADEQRRPAHWILRQLRDGAGALTGLATAAGEAGADLTQVMRETSHRSAKVAFGYL